MVQSELSDLVGLSFSSQGNQSLLIEDTNSKGETVGTSYFRYADGSIGVEERIAWYWHPENGFQIITSRTELLAAYGKNIRDQFYFGKFKINESGEVAGYFMPTQEKLPQFAWFWWSSNAGLRLCEEPLRHQILKDINDCGCVLLSSFCKEPPNLNIKLINIYDMKCMQSMDFSPFEFASNLEEELINIYSQTHFLPFFKVKCSIKCDVLNAIEIDNSFKVIGEGTCRAYFNTKKLRHIWRIKIGFEIENGIAIFYIKKIHHSLAEDSPHDIEFPDMSFIFYEKKI